MDQQDWGSAQWQDDHFPTDQLDEDGDTWGIRWRGMEKLRHRSYIKAVSNTLCGNEPQKILDIGCALCDFTEKAWNVNPNNHMFGMDISPSAISWASQNFPSFKLRQGALPELPFAEEFDGVFLLEVICYLSAEDRKKTISNIHDALKPGGWLMFSGVLDGGNLHHTEEEVNALIGEHFVITDRIYNYWTAYRNVFEGPLNSVRSKTGRLLSQLSLSGEEFDLLAINDSNNKTLKLSRILRKVSPLSTILLRAVNAVLTSLLGSKTIAIVFKGWAMLFRGKGRADEIAVLAHKRTG